MPLARITVASIVLARAGRDCPSSSDSVASGGRRGPFEATPFVEKERSGSALVLFVHSECELEAGGGARVSHANPECGAHHLARASLVFCVSRRLCCATDRLREAAGRGISAVRGVSSALRAVRVFRGSSDVLPRRRHGLSPMHAVGDNATVVTNARRGAGGKEQVVGHRGTPGTGVDAGSRLGRKERSCSREGRCSSGERSAAPASR
jgi:hypothetical protein